METSPGPSGTHRSRGQVLIQAIVAAVIVGIVSLSFITMFKSQSKATRQIASLGGVTDLSHALDALFGSPLCASAGNYLMGGAPVSVVLNAGTYSLALDTLQFANGSTAITSRPNGNIASMIRPFLVQPITMNALGGNGPSGAGFVFPFNLVVSFISPNGPPPLSLPGPPPPLPLSKFILVYTDGANKVLGACYAPQGMKLSVAQPFAFAVNAAGINLVDGQANTAGFPTASTYTYPPGGGFIATVPIANAGNYLISVRGNFNWNTTPAYNCFAGPSWSDYITYTPSLSATHANGTTTLIGTQGVGTPNSGADFSMQQVLNLTAGDTLSFKLISQFAQNRSNAAAGGCVSDYSVTGGLLQVVAVQ